MPKLAASANIAGGRIDLRFEQTYASSQIPDLRVVRRRFGYPAAPADGLVIADLADLFTGAGTPWARIVRRRYLITNATTEGGLVQAQVTEYFAPGASNPAAVAIAVHDGVVDEARADPPHPIGRITVGVGELQWWLPLAKDPITIRFDYEEEETTTSSVDGTNISFVTTAGPRPIRVVGVIDEFGTRIITPAQTPATTIRTIVLEQEAADTDTKTLTIRIADEAPSLRGPRAAKALSPETTYYYTVYEPDGQGCLRTHPGWSASALATGTYSFADKLYGLLPSIHRYYDEPAPGAPPGHLRRFLGVFGAALDHTRSLSEGLSTLRDVFHAGLDPLVHLARWIGWELDRIAPQHLQRADVLFAPKLFATVGAAPNIAALVARMTGWNCHIKEFADNVFFTNAPEPIHLWDLWQTTRSIGDTAWSAPGSLTDVEPDAFDGRPSAVLDSGVPWLFWHSNRSGRRLIWQQRRSTGQAPSRAIEPVNAEHTDEQPAALRDGSDVLLFWSSNRDGARDIWTVRYPNGATPTHPPEPVMTHPADDASPAAIRESDGTIHLFWQSNRRGPSDIWTARLPNGQGWGPPRRISGGTTRDHSPAAVIDGNTIRAFWTAEQGDRSRIVESVWMGSTWSTPVPITPETPLARDESPCAVRWNGEVWLFWHSNRGSRWRIWATVRRGGRWETPVPIFGRGDTEHDGDPIDLATAAHIPGDKEPHAMVDDTDTLYLFFRSQRRGVSFRSCTFEGRRHRRGQLDDRMHYTYDTAKGPLDWYARDTVGIYLRPPTPRPSDVFDQARRVRDFIEPFRPLNVRFVWFLWNADGNSWDPLFAPIARPRPAPPPPRPPRPDV